MALSFIGGALIERVIIRPVEQSSPLVIVIVTIGLFLAINSIAQLHFGSATSRRCPRVYAEQTWLPGDVQISTDTLVLVGVLAVECALLYLLLHRTKLGLAFRGVVANPESSRLVGVPVGRMLMLGWGLAAAIGALAGALVDPATAGLGPSSMQGDPRVRVRGRGAGWIRQPARRGRRRHDRRRRRPLTTRTSTRCTTSSSSCRSG